MGQLTVEYTSSGAPTTERVEIWMRNAFDFVWALLTEKAAVLHEFVVVAGLKEGVPHEVATRFKKGGLAAAAYSSGDASTWPAASKSAGTPALPVVTALNVTRVADKLTLAFTGGQIGAWVSAKFEKNINGAGWSTISDAVANTNSVDYDLVGAERSGTGDFRVTLRTNWVAGATFTHAGVDLGYPPPYSVEVTRSCPEGSFGPPEFAIYIAISEPAANTRVERSFNGGPWQAWAFLAPGVADAGSYDPPVHSSGATINFRARHENGLLISIWTESGPDLIGTCP